MTDENIQGSTTRFFRTYVAFVNDASRDALFAWLEAMHSLRDRLKVSGNIDLLEFNEFRSLKCLRNYFHHHAELKHKLKVLRCDGVSLISDLMVLCLIPLEQVQAALTEESDKYREQVRTAMMSVFKQYSQVININPSIFNLVARTSLVLEKNDLVPIGCPAYDQLRNSMDFERQNGHLHFVTGDITCHAGDIQIVLERLMTVEE